MAVPALPGARFILVKTGFTFVGGLESGSDGPSHACDQMPEIGKHPLAKLYPSELVTIGILFALKGKGFRGITPL